MEKDLVQSCISNFERMRIHRSAFDQDWNGIRDFVRPVTVSFNNMSGQYTAIRPETMFDGTAPNSLEELASALHSYLTNPSERWFELQFEGVNQHMLDPESLSWLEQASDTIYAYYMREDSNLNAALHENYMDLGSFGTSVLLQEWDSTRGGFIFYAIPLAQCFLMENSKNRVDTVYRHLTWTVRQCKQEFGDLLPPKLLEIKDQEKYVELLHCVFPRTNEMRGYTPSRKPHASVWLSLTTKEIIKESGYDTFPYHCPRWTKLAGEFYGRGPARKCLPDIKMLNTMERTLLKAGQKAVDPPLVLANEGFMLPIRTSPGSLIYKEDEDRKIEPLKFEGNLPWGEEKAEQKRAFIRQCFYADWIRMEKENKEMTAFEVQDRRDEKLRLLAPIFGRLVMELHGPMIARSYNLLNAMGRIPAPQTNISKYPLSVGYMSPASRAQTGSRANQISRYFQDLIPMAQIDPSIMDAIDLDKAAKEIALARGTPRMILRSDEDVASMREQKQKMQAAQTAAAVAEPASKAVKNLSDAQTAGGPLGTGMGL